MMPAGVVITPTASGRTADLTVPIAMSVVGAVAAVGTIVYFATQDNNNSSVSAPAQ